MGETPSENMVRSRSLLLLLAALASTVVAATTSADWKRGLDAIVTKLQTNDDASALVQDVDTLVPENRDPLEVADESPAKLAAREVTTMLQQGKKQDECEKLAEDLCKTVSEKVRIFDEQIEDLSDGSDCKDKGQILVKKTTQEVNTLEITLKTRTNEAAKLANAGVDFGTYPLNTLEESECGQFWQDDAYVTAKQASQNAAELVTETSTELTTLKLQLKEAIERAEEKRTECECDVRAAYNSLYNSATSTAEEDAAAYAKCKHMKCFLKTKNSEECLNLKFVVPTVSQEKTFANGVPKQECTASAPSLRPSPSPMVAISRQDILPPPRNIVEVAKLVPFLSKFVAAVTAADLVETLSSPGPFTVFAPTNDAFAALPAGTLASLMLPENKGTLVDILTYAVVSSKVLTTDLGPIQEVATIQGDTVLIKAQSGAVTVNGNNVVAADNEATNGLIHIIDGVLLPPRPQPKARRE